MTKISLTSMGIAFMSMVLFFSVFGIGYNIASEIYNTSGLNNTVFDEFGDSDDYKSYLNETKTVYDDLQADKSAFDVIGDLIVTALTPVRIIIKGATFLIGSFGKLLGYIGVPKIIQDFVAGVLTFIVATIFLFAIILGRRDKND